MNLEAEKTFDFELWVEPTGYKFFASSNEAMRSQLSSNAKLIWRVTAKTWDEAQRKKNEFLSLCDETPSASMQTGNININSRTDDISPIIDLIKSHYKTH